jgi:sialidase-1
MRSHLVVSIGVFLLAGRGAAAEPTFERSDVFEAGRGGYAFYRIPGLVVTAKGTLLAYCEARLDRSDWGAMDVLVRRSTDGGTTWSAPMKLPSVEGPIARNPAAVKKNLGKDGEVVHNNPIAIADRNGAIHFLFCVNYNRCFYTRSVDDGKTCDKPREITDAFAPFRPEYDWQVLATGPGHGIQLKNGRLLVPLWLALGTGGNAHRPSCVSVIVSDDGGANWRRGEIVCNDPQPKNPNETTAVQLADGRVMLNIRHESEPRLRGVSVSDNGATGWSPLRFDRGLPDPICEGSLVRLTEPPADARTRLLFTNPHNPMGRERKNLTVKLSYDEGETWAVAKTIEPGVSGYADLAIGPGGRIYCLFERGAGKASILSLARFNLEWLTDGRDHPGK